MLDLIGFFIKFIFSGLLGAFCNYNRFNEEQENIQEDMNLMYISAIIGIIGMISTSFAKLVNNQNPAILMVIMVIASIFIAHTILKEMERKIGIREYFALIIGWYIGIGKILHGIFLLLVLVFFLLRFLENKDQEV